MFPFVETTFSKWLQAEMDRREMSVPQLAVAMKSPPGTIYRLLNDERGIGRRVVKKLSAALGMPEEDIWKVISDKKGKGATSELEPKHWELLSLFNDMSEDEQDDELATLRLRAERRRRGSNGKRAPGATQP